MIRHIAFVLLLALVACGEPLPDGLRQGPAACVQVVTEFRVTIIPARDIAATCNLEAVDACEYLGRIWMPRPVTDMEIVAWMALLRHEIAHVGCGAYENWPDAKRGRA